MDPPGPGVLDPPKEKKTKLEKKKQQIKES